MRQSTGRRSWMGCPSASNGKRLPVRSDSSWKAILRRGGIWSPPVSWGRSRCGGVWDALGKKHTHQAGPRGSAGAERGPAARENRLIELRQLHERVASCTRCPELAATRTQTVFGTGPIDIDVCFIGEAPGADEDRRGEPFVGVAGQLLTR